jgi:regulator of sigma E protease
MASIGLPRLLPYIADVAPNSPASIAKLQKDDKILSINNQEVKYWYQVGELINSSNGMVDMRIQRDDKIIDLTIEPKEVTIKNRFNEEIKRHIIGISPELKQVTQRLNPIDALSYAYDETIKASKMIFKGIQKMIVGDVDTKEIGGVISIVDITSKASNAGILALLFFTAIISVNLGVLNLLPIPALDGGHIMFNLYEMISGKEANEKVMYYLTVAGWIILLSLMLLGVYNDINRILD